MRKSERTLNIPIYHLYSTCASYRTTSSSSATSVNDVKSTETSQSEFEPDDIQRKSHFINQKRFE